MTQQVNSMTRGTTIPDDYLRLGRVAGPKLPPVHRLRLFLHGKVGEGKTTFCASIPNSVFFDCENKATNVASNPSQLVVYAETAEEYDVVIDKLVKDKRAGTSPFDTVIIDPITSFIHLVRDKLTREYRRAGILRTKAPSQDITSYGQGGAGWGDINKAVADVFIKLYNAGYGWVATGHQMPKWRKQRDGTELLTWASNINDGILGFLFKEAEYSGMIGKHQEEYSIPATSRRVPGRKGGFTEIPGKAKMAFRDVYTLSMLPPDPQLPARQHVPIADRIILPPQGAAAEFQTAYDEGVRARLATGDMT